MSNLAKFFLMALVWGLLYLASYYGCIRNEAYCNEGDVTETSTPVTPPPAVTNDYSLASSIGSAAILTGTGWAAEKGDLLARYQADTSKMLEITGHYYASEPKPADYDNMGLLRADSIKALLVEQTGISANKITLAARLMEGEPASSPWDAGSFRFTEPVTEDNAEKAEVIELDEFTKIILFPYNSATKDVDPSIDAYLVTLAKRMQQTGEKVTLVGHTDDRGRPEYNMELGQRRADFVKRILVRNGAPEANITTSSRGESQFRVPNNSAANRHRNRRVVVTLVQ